MALYHHEDDTVEALCSRCLSSSPVVATEADLIALDRELRADVQTWCLECSSGERAPKGRPNQRGVVRRRRSR